jgi:hypothetical protein
MIDNIIIISTLCGLFVYSVAWVLAKLDRFNPEYESLQRAWLGIVIYSVIACLCVYGVYAFCMTLAKVV